jgi:hypothetical protein
MSFFLIKASKVTNYFLENSRSGEKMMKSERRNLVEEILLFRFFPAQKNSYYKVEVFPFLFLMVYAPNRMK